MQRVAFMYIVRLGDVMPSSLHTRAGPMRQVYDKSYYMGLLRWLWCVFTGYGGACDVWIMMFYFLCEHGSASFFTSAPIGNLSIYCMWWFYYDSGLGQGIQSPTHHYPYTVLPLYFPTVALLYIRTYVCMSSSNFPFSLLLPTSLWPLSLSL